MKKTSIHLEIILKSLEFFEKASHYFKKASISFKMASTFLKKPHNSYYSLLVSEIVFKKPQNF
jgi:hypothetical protein